MKEIYWKKLTTFEKTAFVLGWLSVGNALFWIVLLLKRFQFPGPVAQKELLHPVHGKSQSIYQKLFNPDTYKVVYVFGWINLVALSIFLFIMLMIVLFLAIR